MNASLQSLTLRQLYDTINDAEIRKANVLAQLDALQDELVLRLADEASGLFAAASKESGDVTFTAHDGLQFKASISKTVKWDNDKLRAIASKLDVDAIDRIFDIKFSVPERTFQALPDPALHAELTAARTVKYGELKIVPLKRD